MDVELYVYDLTHGMARSLSPQLLGITIDAVYHTSLVFGPTSQQIEYYFGAGIQTCRAGTTHHGRPMQTINLGTTHLPLDTILEYLESLKQIYTPQSYDLFAHNCNNFSNDFAMFLVGRGIPDHITSLPKRVLDTPFGQMLRPQIDASMRGITQAPTNPANHLSSAPSSHNTSIRSSSNAPSATGRGKQPFGSVINVTAPSILQSHLSEAKSQQTCATIFFTSATCAPCRVAYPTYDSLAATHSQCLFLKIDISSATEIASQHSIRATPTFKTYNAQGSLVDTWQGADPNILRMNVEKLIRTTFPPHSHAAASVRSLQFGSMEMITYARVPPLAKLLTKLGGAAEEERGLRELKQFIEKKGDGEGTEIAALPNLTVVSEYFRERIWALPLAVQFAAVDLLRVAMVDARVSGFFAEDERHTVARVLEHVVGLAETCPHNLRLVTIHLASNLFSSPLFIKELMGPRNGGVEPMVQLVTSSLLDTDHSTTRVAAASLAFNLAVSNYRVRREEQREALNEGHQVELVASLVETISLEANGDAVKALLLALGYFIYYAPEEGEIMDLCKALNAKETVLAAKENAPLAKDIASLL